MGAEARLIQLVGHNGVARRLHEVQAAPRFQVPGGDEVGHALLDVCTHGNKTVRELGVGKKVFGHVFWLRLFLAGICPLANHSAHPGHHHLKTLFQNHTVQCPRRQHVMAAHGVLIVGVDLPTNQRHQLLEHDTQSHQLLPAGFRVCQEKAPDHVGADLLVGEAPGQLPAQNDPEHASEVTLRVAVCGKRLLHGLLLHHHQHALP
mmetsp:Transcript_101753/g.293046  ORF Transcript_101753/g.293046 Transcript_101753/m.293046 type:complete len:205 (-) Transcript_101753:543-1157(-)